MESSLVRLQPNSATRQRSIVDPASNQIKRTTFMVRDAEKAARWYEQVFGMTLWMDTPFTLSGNQLAAGQKGDKTRLVIIKASHDVIGMIGLLEWLDPKQDAPPRMRGCKAFLSITISTGGTR